MGRRRVALLAAALAARAWGVGPDDGSIGDPPGAGGDTGDRAEVQRAASNRGLTPESIRLWVTLMNFDALWQPAEAAVALPVRSHGVCSRA